MTDAVLAEGEHTQVADEGQQTAEVTLGEGTQAEASNEQSAENKEQAEQGNKEGSETKPEGAPEAYDFKAPEGKEFDSTVLSQFSEVAKELNLTQENAQKILDKMAPALEAQQQQAIEGVQESWKQALPSDKEFGGNDYKNNLAVANEGLTRVASPELISLLKQTGMNYHPEIVRVFYRVGKMVSGDNIVVGDAGKPSANNHLDALYPTSKKE